MRDFAEAAHSFLRGQRFGNYRCGIVNNKKEPLQLERLFL